MKLSIIVPVYNVAPYLRKCVESLLAQDYDNYEIILVDDGSTDESGAICDEYASRSFANSFTHLPVPIRVVHRENGGLSAARNSGIEVAQGEYLMFVDSDDYIEPNVLKGQREQLEREELDVLRYDYQNVRLKNEGYEFFQPYKHPHQPDSQHAIVDGETYLNTRMGYACYAWQFILRRDLIISTPYTIHHTPENGDCLFTEGIHFEDVDWLPRMMLRAKRVNSTQTIVYNYFIRQGSITQVQGNKEKIRKNLEDRMKIIETYSKHIEQYPSCTWLKNMQSNMVAGVLTTVAQSFYPERRDYISQLKAINVFPLSMADQGETYVRRAKFINALGPYVYCWFMHVYL